MTYPRRMSVYSPASNETADFIPPRRGIRPLFLQEKYGTSSRESLKNKNKNTASGGVAAESEHARNIESTIEAAKAVCEIGLTDVSDHYNYWSIFISFDAQFSEHLSPLGKGPGPTLPPLSSPRLHLTAFHSRPTPSLLVLLAPSVVHPNPSRSRLIFLLARTLSNNQPSLTFNLLNSAEDLMIIHSLVNLPSLQQTLSRQQLQSPHPIWSFLVSVLHSLPLLAQPLPFLPTLQTAMWNLHRLLAL